MAIRTFCDVCDCELTRNVVRKRLIVSSHTFVAEVVISKDSAENNGDLCLNCLMDMLNQKPKRKYERKPKAATNQPQTEIFTLEEAASPNPPDLTYNEPVELISTFSVVTGQDGKNHTLKMGDTAVSAKTLKAGVSELLGLHGLTEKDIEDAPESEGKRKLLKILKV